jgi:hypothetical protein
MVTSIKRGSSRKTIQMALKKWNVRKRHIDLKKYCGIIIIKEEPLKLQKAWRNEWE